MNYKIKIIEIYEKKSFYLLRNLFFFGSFRNPYMTNIIFVKSLNK